MRPSPRFTADVQVAPELPLQRPPHRLLLRLEETLQHHGDRQIDVALVHVLPQVHARVRLRHPDDGLEVAQRDLWGRIKGIVSKFGVNLL
jgi:hypothetical protein